ncbi:MAG: hypothetical protein NTY03_13105, partial [Candidatus Bathyarchaeota archaeon]|nr:hypothetical protein [Candidatus Bathyarchaeota archaeon]
ADSSVLIWLAKAGRLDLLRDQYQVVLIPSEVYSEVVEDGLREGYPDAHVVKEAVEHGWITVEDNPDGGRKKRLTDDLSELHEGEAAAMALAHSRDLTPLMKILQGNP